MKTKVTVHFGKPDEFQPAIATYSDSRSAEDRVIMLLYFMDNPDKRGNLILAEPDDGGIKKIVIERVTEKSKPEIPPDAKILKFLRTGGKDWGEIADCLEISLARTKDHLDRLVSEKKIGTVRDRKGRTYYQLV